MFKRLICWIYGWDKDELDKLAQAKDRDIPWSDWAKDVSKK